MKNLALAEKKNIWRWKLSLSGVQPVDAKVQEIKENSTSLKHLQLFIETNFKMKVFFLILRTCRLDYNRCHSQLSAVNALNTITATKSTVVN